MKEGEGKPILIFHAEKQEMVSKIVTWKEDSSVPHKVTKNQTHVTNRTLRVWGMTGVSFLPQSAKVAAAKSRNAGKVLHANYSGHLQESGGGVADWARSGKGPRFCNSGQLQVSAAAAQSSPTPNSVHRVKRATCLHSTGHQLATVPSFLPVCGQHTPRDSFPLVLSTEPCTLLQLRSHPPPSFRGQLIFRLVPALTSQLLLVTGHCPHTCLPADQPGAASSSVLPSSRPCRNSGPCSPPGSPHCLPSPSFWPLLPSCLDSQELLGFPELHFGPSPVVPSLS